MESLIYQIEAPVDLKPEKIKAFFEEKKFVVQNLIKDEKNENINLNIFTITFQKTKDFIMDLQMIKDDELDKKVGFNILLSKEEPAGLLEKLLKEEKSKKTIEYKTRYEDLIDINYIKQPGDFGLELVSQEILKNHSDVLGYMASTFGNNILQGKSIMNVSLPIFIFDEKSVLDDMMFTLKLFPSFNMHLHKDPLERLKISTTYILASLHLTLSMKKPFNPILGETFQCEIDEMKIYMEQTSHHPPCYNLYITHPFFTIQGYNYLESKTGANNIEVYSKGKFVTKYKDGIEHRSTYPTFKIEGFMVGRKLVNFEGNLTVQDVTNELISCVKFNPDERGAIGKIFKSKKNLPDYIKGFIAKGANVKYDNAKNQFYCDKKHILASIEGEWTRFVEIDKKSYWNRNNLVLHPSKKMEFTLPSDCLFRDDLLLFKKGDIELAQQAKINLEERQRNDRKLREAFRNRKN